MQQVPVGTVINNNTTVQQTTVVVVHRGEPNLLIRFIWFLFIGSWLSLVAIFIGYALCLTVIGLPLGIALLNRIPKIATLKEPPPDVQVHTDGQTGAVSVTLGRQQRPFWQRALWYVCVGWWATAIWLGAAYVLQTLGALFTVLLVTAPIGLPLLAVVFWMYGQVGLLLTLRR